MIQPTELPRTIWVYSIQLAKEVQISSIDYDDGLTFIGEATWDYNTEEMIKPITLSEEKLLKCGFKHGSDDGIKHWFALGNFIVNKSDWDDKFILEIGDIEVKHLHLLQNLYFELNNQELIYTP